MEFVYRNTGWGPKMRTHEVLEVVPSSGRRAVQPHFHDLTPFAEAAERGVDEDEMACAYLMFSARGAGMVAANGEEWPLLRGSACLTYTRPEVMGPVLRGWALSLAGDCLGMRARLRPGVRKLPAGVVTRCLGFFESLEAELDRGARLIDPVAIQALLDLILLCYERAPHPDLAAPRPSDERVSQAHLLVDEMLEFIDEHFTERLSLADLALGLNRSDSSLSRASRAVTGKSVLELIAERRIKEAERLLLETTLPVGEIASQVGYPNLGHFHRAFRRATSLTPREWRADASRVLATSR